MIILTLCLGVCGRLHVFFPLVTTSTPISVCIRIRFSEYLAVPAMIPAEESASSGIKLIFLPDIPPPYDCMHYYILRNEYQ